MEGANSLIPHAEKVKEMRTLVLSIPMFLIACTPAVPERDWNATFSPYGKWKSDLGFTIDITRDKKYEVCDGEKCSGDRYVDQGGGDLILINFRKMEASQRLMAEADVIGPCDDQSCGTPNELRYNWHNDIYFYDNVANVDHRHQCGGDRECIVLGNVETAEGMFYKIAKH